HLRPAAETLSQWRAQLLLRRVPWPGLRDVLSMHSRRDSNRSSAKSISSHSSGQLRQALCQRRQSRPSFEASSLLLTRSPHCLEPDLARLFYLLPSLGWRLLLGGTEALVSGPALQRSLLRRRCLPAVLQRLGLPIRGHS